MTSLMRAKVHVTTETERKENRSASQCSSQRLRPETESQVITSCNDCSRSLHNIIMAVHSGGLVGILDVLDMSFTVFHVVVCVGVGLVGDNALFAGNMTSTAQVIFRLSVIDEQLTILAVAARLISCNLDKVPNRCGLVEDVVHLLQRTVGGLRVEEVDDGEDKSVTEEHQSQQLFTQRIRRRAATYITAKIM